VVNEVFHSNCKDVK